MNFIVKSIVHGIFWTVFIAISVLISMVKSNVAEFGDLSPLLLHLLINLVWAAVAFYLFYGYGIRYIEQKKFFHYFAFLVFSSIMISLVFLLLHWLINPGFRILNYKASLPPMIGTFVIAQCGSLIRGFEVWFSNLTQKAELENRHLKNELEVLKSQINPHFLFNTLNNIDSFIHTSPEEASKALITLSDLLRYMVYDTKSDKVPLAKEIDYLQNFIKLQHVRFKDPQYIRVTVPDNCRGIEIAPLLFMPFIENAFKYAQNNGVLPVIQISLECNLEKISFRCMNAFEEEKKEHQRPGGVGLENVKRRLALLYPGKHKLLILKEKGVFCVDLSIQLL